MTQSSRIDDELREREHAFQDFAYGKITLSRKQWTEILGDRSLMSEDNIALLSRIYVSPNHAASCKELGRQDNVHPTSFIAPVVGMAKRITAAYHLPALYYAPGERFWWPVLFLGRYAIDGHFEWKMRPELADAFEKSCSEQIERAHYHEDVRKSAVLSDDEVLRIAVEHSKRVCQKRAVTTEQYVRDPYISETAKRRANGICCLCRNPAPFKDKAGKPYLETHHIQWLSRGGKDSLDNVVALCPNCHAKIHILDREEDRKLLTDRVHGSSKAPPALSSGKQRRKD